MSDAHGDAGVPPAAWHDQHASVLRISVAASGADAFGDALLASGADSVSIEAAPGAPAIYGEPGCEPGAYWASCVAVVVFPAGVDIEAAVAAAAATARVGALPLAEAVPLRERDWARAARDGFAAWHLTPTLVVAPPWLAEFGGARVVVIDPGPAFGTGDHATTRLCGAWLARVVRGGERVLDFGCGTGILGLIALALGAQRALGVDVDPRALAAAGANATASGLSLELGAAIPPGFRAEIVVANILAGPLVDVASALSLALAPGGTLAVAGVREAEVGLVRDAYARATAGALDLCVHDQEGDWVLLAGSSPP